MKICSLCGSTFDDRIEFCFSDGTPLEKKVARRRGPVVGGGIPTLGNMGFDVPEPRNLRFDDVPEPGHLRREVPLPDPEDVPDPPALVAQSNKAPPPATEVQSPIVPVLSDAPTMPVPLDQGRSFEDMLDPEEAIEESPTLPLRHQESAAHAGLGHLHHDLHFSDPEETGPLPERPESTEDIEELDSSDLAPGVRGSGVSSSDTSPFDEPLERFERKDTERSLAPLLLGIAAVFIVAVGGGAVLLAKGLGKAPLVESPEPVVVEASAPVEKGPPAGTARPPRPPVEAKAPEVNPVTSAPAIPTEGPATPERAVPPPHEDATTGPWGETPAPKAAVVRTVRFESKPAGARIQVDGKPVAGVTPMEVPGISDGFHVVRVELAEHKDSEVGVVVGESSALVSVRLEPAAKAPEPRNPAPTAVVTREVRLFAGDPDAKVTLGDQNLGGVPIDLELPVGEYEFVVTLSEEQYIVRRAVKAGTDRQLISLSK